LRSMVSSGDYSLVIHIEKKSDIKDAIFSFTSLSDSDWNLVDQFKKILSEQSNVKGRILQDTDKAITIALLPSTGMGSAGTYITNAREYAINFGNNPNLFQAYLKIANAGEARYMHNMEKYAFYHSELETVELDALLIKTPVAEFSHDMYQGDNWDNYGRARVAKFEEERNTRSGFEHNKQLIQESSRAKPIVKKFEDAIHSSLPKVNFSLSWSVNSPASNTAVYQSAGHVVEVELNTADKSVSNKLEEMLSQARTSHTDYYLDIKNDKIRLFIGVDALDALTSSVEESKDQINPAKKPPGFETKGVNS
jgi:hypothetical protein